MAKSKLPDNWKPCKVKYAATPDQYAINDWAYACSKDWEEGLGNDRQYSWLNLYKTPGLWRFYTKYLKSSSYLLPSNWRSVLAP